MPTKTPSDILLGTPPSETYRPKARELSDLLDEMIVSDVIALGDKADPFLLLGSAQSNGAGSNPQAAGGDLSVNPNIFIWWNNAWEICDPANGIGVPVAGRNLPAFQAAKELLRRGYPAVYIVNDAHPEQPISQWVGNGTASIYYQTMKNKIEAALASDRMVELGKTKVDAFLHIHGESNNGLSGNTSTRESYAADVDTLKAQMRAEDWFDDDTPIALTEIGAKNGFKSRNDFFRSLALTSDPYVYVTESKDLDVGADNTHYTGLAINELGKRIAVNLMAARPKPLAADPSIVDGPWLNVLEPVFLKGWSTSFEDNTALFTPYNINIGDITTSGLGFSFTTGRIEIRASVALDIEGLTNVIGRLAVRGKIIVSDVGQVRLGEFQEADLLSATASVNTDVDKGRGGIGMNVTRGSLVQAVGNADASVWNEHMPDYTITPGGGRVVNPDAGNIFTQILPDGTNLNNVFKEGVYAVDSNVAGGKPESNGILVVLPRSSTSCIQTFVTRNGTNAGVMYSRATNSSGVFVNDWRRASNPEPETDKFTTMSASFALSKTPVSKKHVSVYFDVSYQDPESYSLSGNTVTFNAGAPSGVAAVFIEYTYY